MEIFDFEKCKTPWAVIVSACFLMASFFGVVGSIVKAQGMSDFVVFGDVSSVYNPGPEAVTVTIHNVRTNETLYDFSDTGTYEINLADFENGFQAGDQIIVEAVDTNVYGGLGRDSTNTDVTGGATQKRVDLVLARDWLPFGPPDDPVISKSRLLALTTGNLQAKMWCRR